MPIALSKILKCGKCKKKVHVMIGDMRPQKIVCPHCGHVWFYVD